MYFQTFKSASINEPPVVHHLLIEWPMYDEPFFVKITNIVMEQNFQVILLLKEIMHRDL